MYYGFEDGGVVFLDGFFEVYWIGDFKCYFVGVDFVVWIVVDYDFDVYYGEVEYGVVLYGFFYIFLGWFDVFFGYGVVDYGVFEDEICIGFEGFDM